MTNMTRFFGLFALLASSGLCANTLLMLSDDQFKRLLGNGIPDECVKYYLGDLNDLTTEIEHMKIIDIPGRAARSPNKAEKDQTFNQLIAVLEERCYLDVKRAIVTNNYYKDMPKELNADDFSDRRVLDRYIKLIGLDQ